MTPSSLISTVPLLAPARLPSGCSTHDETHDGYTTARPRTARSHATATANAPPTHGISTRRADYVYIV